MNGHGRKGTLAQALGWFSIGLGLAQVTIPGRVARLIGVSDGDRSRALMRLAGLRELVCGFGLLANSRPTGWLWARVAGDVKDLAVLGAALNAAREPGRVMAAMAAVAGIMALDLRGARRHGRGGNAIEVKQAITINRSPEDLYHFWRDFQNLPRFMNHVESVRVTSGGRRSHWTVKAPAGKTVEWDAEIVEDRRNELIAWRSLEGADVPNSGSVRFAPAPGGRGAEVHVELRYDPPGGALGSTIAKLFGEEPAQQAWDDLRALKQVMEAGEIVLSDASLHGRPHPARPPAADEISA